MADEQSTSLHEEPFTGGMDIAEDPTKLGAGEFALAANCYYEYNSDPLLPPPSRSALGVTNSGSTVVGLRGINIRNVGTRLVAQANSRLYTRDPSSAGAFTSAETLAADGVGMEVIQRDDTVAYALTGNDYNRAFYNNNQALTVRRMGMLPVTDAPVLSDSGQQFLDGSTTVQGYYEYWTTEVVKFADGTELESTFGDVNSKGDFAAQPTTWNVANAANDAPTVTLPIVSNSNATHWRVYRSVKKTAATDKLFPIGYQVSGDIDITQPTWTDTLTTTATSGLAPTGAGPSFGVVPWFGATRDFANESQGYVAGGGGATVTKTGGYTSISYMPAGTFGVTGLTGGIAGVKLVVKASASVLTGNPRVSVKIAAVDLSQAAGSRGFTQFASKSATITSTSLTDYTFGGSSDDWLPTDVFWSPSDFTDTRFIVFIGVSQLSGTAGTLFTIDGITLTLYYAAAKGGNVLRPFPAVTISNEVGIELSCGANSPPPDATSGDMFTEQAVVNDFDVKGIVRYSLAGSPEYFPSLYYVKFPLAAADRITCVKRLGRVLLVGGQYGLWRVNYLPTQADVSMDRGRVWDDIDPLTGPLSESAFTTYRGQDGRVLFAYVTKTDIRSSDGFTSWPMVPDFPVSKEVDSSQPVVLINNPENWELILYYTAKSTGQTKAVLGWNYGSIRMNYHPEHLRPGQDGKPILKCSGVIAAANKVSATEAQVRSGTYFPSGLGTVWAGYAGSGTSGGGSVYYDQPLATVGTYPTTDNTVLVNSRMMYLNGMGKSWRVGDIYLDHNDPVNSGAMTFTVTPTTVKTNDTYRDQTAKTVAALNSQAASVLQRCNFLRGCEGLKLKLTGTANKLFSLNKWVMVGEDFGYEESGK